MATTQEEWVKHQQKQGDIKGFLTALNLFQNSEDTELRDLARKKAKELIPQISLEIKESTIKPLQ